jgi:hypothetical protein
MVPMTSLRRAKNGDWYSRKGIPADVRDAYKAAYGRSHEEIFRQPSIASSNSFGNGTRT